MSLLKIALAKTSGASLLGKLVLGGVVVTSLGAAGATGIYTVAHDTGAPSSAVVTDSPSPAASQSAKPSHAPEAPEHASDTAKEHAADNSAVQGAVVPGASLSPEPEATKSEHSGRDASEAPEASDAPEASEAPEASDAPEASQAPEPTESATHDVGDDHGGGSSSAPTGSGGSGHDSGGDNGSGGHGTDG